VFLLVPTFALVAPQAEVNVGTRTLAAGLAHPNHGSGDDAEDDVTAMH